MQKEKTVLRIDRQNTLPLAASLEPKSVRRVAAYARVSTDKDEQFSSYEAQIDYYTKYITAREDWVFLKVYTDEGISGTSIRFRRGFCEMINDALQGKIDLIVTKSISRFARNTVDSLTTIRKLKEAGCEVFFEKENIYTFDSKGELLITIMSSLAQEESRSLSENVTWGTRKRFADGKYFLRYKTFLGYRKGADGMPEIHPAEATVVRRIYWMCIEGLSLYHIARILTEDQIPTPCGKSLWYYNVVQSILTNEKYKGDALLQKTYSTSFLTKCRQKNTGEVPQYYVHNGHAAIIEESLFEEVREQLPRLQSSRFREGDKFFSKRIKCGICGNWYCQAVRKPQTEKERRFWRCNRRGLKHACGSPYLQEQEIARFWEEAKKRLLTDHPERLAEALSGLIVPNRQLEACRAEIEELNAYLGFYPESPCKKRIRELRAQIARAEQVNAILLGGGENGWTPDRIRKLRNRKLLDQTIDFLTVDREKKVTVTLTNGFCFPLFVKPTAH